MHSLMRTAGGYSVFLVGNAVGEDVSVKHHQACKACK